MPDEGQGQIVFTCVPCFGFEYDYRFTLCSEIQLARSCGYIACRRLDTDTSISDRLLNVCNYIVSFCC